MKKNLILKFTTLLGLFALAGCGNNTTTPATEAPLTSPSAEVSASAEATEAAVEATATVAAEEATQETSSASSDTASLNSNEYDAILGKTNWTGTVVKDADGNDLTAENSNFIGLAKYDPVTNRYEFFDQTTGETRGDSGVFFMTNDGQKRILISQSNNYQAVVEITELNDNKFTYKRQGKDKDGNDIEIFVEHVPYTEKELAFTTEAPALNASTGEIITSENGDAILGKTLWNGTKIYDENGEDVTEFNKGFISLAKYDPTTNQYEFFDIESGDSRGDFGYFNVINNNKERAHVSIGENKYGAVLEITELNDNKFTYKRQGKNKNDEDIIIFVEHEPYTGTLTPEFTF